MKKSRNNLFRDFFLLLVEWHLSSGQRCYATWFPVERNMQDRSFPVPSGTKGMPCNFVEGGYSVESGKLTQWKVESGKWMSCHVMSTEAETSYVGKLKVESGQLPALPRRDTSLSPESAPKMLKTGFNITCEPVASRISLLSVTCEPVASGITR
jgi:hypothetical protein